MSYINRGGPVFPQPQTYGEWADGSPWFEGLGLRDYFAAKAMPLALKILMHDYSREMDDWCWNYEIDTEMLANLSYKLSNAMLRAREAA
jgi:hypothetical protein